MEASPLTQQIRPRLFQPKIANLYENLFKVIILTLKPFINDTNGPRMKMMLFTRRDSGRNSFYLDPTYQAYGVYLKILARTIYCNIRFLDVHSDLDPIINVCD